MVALISPLGDLPCGWRLAKLKQVTTKIGSGATPTGGESSYLPSRDKFALVRSQNIYDRRFDTTGLSFIFDAQALDLANAQLQEGDVLLNITGDGVTFGRACVVPQEVLPACVNQHVSIVRPDERHLLSGYLLAYLTHPEIKPYIESFNSGGSRRAVTKGHIESFVVPLPPLDQQARIASILDALDEKIELNRRMNRTLEEMAQVLFKSWFIDFDPVQAKAAGRKPFGMDEANAALFPSHFEESELGPIPQGWRMARFSKIVEILNGGTPRTTEPTYWGGDIPWFSVVDTPAPGDIFVLQTEKTITASGVAESATRVLPQGTTIITARGTVGNVALTGRPMAMNQSCYGLRGRDGYSDYFIHFATRELVDELRQMSSGSVFDTIIRATFDSVKLPIVPVRLAQYFDAHVESWLAMIRSNLAESQTLTNLRDLLLPKLLSGEIRLRDAENQVGAAA